MKKGDVMARPGPIAIIGSGEMADSMAEVHRALMRRLDGTPRPVFIDTMAGFELNIDGIGAKARAYIERNLNMDLRIASYHRVDDPPEAIAAAVAAIRGGNYLFAGPGSPTYGVRTWRDSAVWRALIESWEAGAMLVFASAAALTLGAKTIPVYEIYKVGQEPFWSEGLDLLGRLGVRAAVVPHWNNRSGDQHDTRYCFIGAPRFALLEDYLDAETLVIGVDEYTALLIDGETGQGEVLGAGEVTLRSHHHQVIFRAGQRFDLAHYRGDTAPVVAIEAFEETRREAGIEAPPGADIQAQRVAALRAAETGDYAACVEALVQLSLAASAGLEQGVYNRAEMAVQALQAALPRLLRFEPGQGGALGGINPQASAALIEGLLRLRADLRASKQWGQADQLRDALLAAGVQIMDGPEGTRWEMK